jgi:hypothetical protein
MASAQSRLLLAAAAVLKTRFPFAHDLPWQQVKVFALPQQNMLLSPRLGGARLFWLSGSPTCSYG